MIKKINILFILFFFLLIFNSSSAQQDKIALLYSKYTERILPDTFWVYNHITFWELFLTNNKMDYEVITDEDLESGLSVNNYSSLIAPSSKVLSDEEIISITNYLSEGGSVFASWSMGYFNKDGSLRGWEAIESIFGVKVISEIKKSEVSLLHSILGDNQFSINVPAGFKMQIITDNLPVKSEITNTTSNALGYWYNYDSLEVSFTPNGKHTSIVYGNYGRGKFVWTGFDEYSIVAGKEYQTNYTTFLLNSLNWLNDNSSAWINTWPGGEKSAVVLSCDVEFQSEKIENALNILNEENVKGQFFILTEAIKRDALNKILNTGDIGLHGDSHELFKWQEFDIQLNRLKSAINLLESETGRKIIAFRPPETMYDEETIKALKQVGIKILSSDFVQDRSVPQYYDKDKNILIIPKPGVDDYDLFFKLKIKDYKKQAERYLIDYRRIHEEGGLYTLYFHSHLQCLNDYVDAIKICINEFKKNRTWIATNLEVRDWWIFKEKLSYSITENGDNQITVDLKNGNATDGKNIVVSLVKDNLNSNIFIKDEKEKKVDFTYNPSTKILKLFIENISSYENKKFIISSEQI